jgi:hypothetical protein
MIIKTGTVLTLENGEYSDFCYEGPFTVLKDFDQRAACEEFVKPYDKDKLRWMGGAEFIAWLAREGYIEDTPQNVRWFLGGCGFNPKITGEA